ncbi:MAG: hypothetical protein MZV63_17090 [Marinilabiliales bacterium]|nr:hypothetical protein [Marinilabiliales bacterium]
MNLRLYNPEVFQGNIKSLNYFEGWYFKNVSAGLDNVYSFIPGISLAKGDRHAFIQVIDGITCKIGIYNLSTRGVQLGQKEFLHQGWEVRIH